MTSRLITATRRPPLFFKASRSRWDNMTQESFFVNRLLAFTTGELETLIFTRPKVGYMLHVRKEDVMILP
jgi:hypothetical protein